MEKSYYRMRYLSWLEGVVPGLLLAEYDMIKQHFLKLNQIPIQNRTILPLLLVSLTLNCSFENIILLLVEEQKEDKIQSSSILTHELFSGKVF